MDMQIIQTIKKMKHSLEDDGFIIDGIFGSYARDEAHKGSDLDILYHLEKNFYERYKGFLGFKRLDEIKELIAKETKTKIDLAPKNNLSKTAQKYILSEVIYV